MAVAADVGRLTLFDSVESQPNPEVRSAESLSLLELEAIAFQHNPTLATAAARTAVARGRQVQAGLYPNPVVGYHATEVGNLGSAGQQGAFISQRFITAGKLRLDQAIAGKKVDEATFQLGAQEKRVLSDLKIRFYDARIAQRRVDLTKELARIGAELVKATEKLMEARHGTENDLLQAEIRADESNILLDNAHNQSHEAWRRLVAVVGIPSMRPVPLVGEPDSDVPSFDWDGCYSMVIGGNPELNAARARVDQVCIALRRAQREPIPNVDVSVSVRHHDITDSDVANIQLGIPLPVFDKNQGNIRSSKAELVAARHEVKRIELRLLDQLAVIYRRYANARQQAERYKERMIPKADRSLRLVTQGYEQGQAEYLTLLTAQQTYIQVSLSYLESLRELRTASSIIEGQLLTDSLVIRR